MKNLFIIILGSFMLISYTGCTKVNDKNSEQSTDSSELKNSANSSSSEKKISSNSTDEHTSINSSSVSENTTSNSTDEVSNSINDDASLSKYSNEQIEYARVWLTLGVHQNIDELNVLKIPAGTLINPNDKSSSVYPYDTIHLSGSRLVDGSVTYSSNGDGTINVYKVPHRWDESSVDNLDDNYMNEFTKSLIDEATVETVDIGNSEDIIKLINIEFIH